MQLRFLQLSNRFFSQSWFTRQVKDHFVQEAHRLDYRSRAAFKLIQLNEKHELIGKGMRILDLGAAPGGWSQVAVELVNGLNGRVLGVDLLLVKPIEGASFIQGDFTDAAVQDMIREKMPVADVITSYQPT